MNEIFDFGCDGFLKEYTVKSVVKIELISGVKINFQGENRDDKLSKPSYRGF